MPIGELLVLGKTANGYAYIGAHASGTGSTRDLRIQYLGGDTYFGSGQSLKITNAGSIVAAGSLSSVVVGGRSDSGMYFTNSGYDTVFARGGLGIAMIGGYFFGLAKSSPIEWSNTDYDPTATKDTYLQRDAAGALKVTTNGTTTFGYMQAKLKTDTAYTAGAPTVSGYVTIYDSTGTAYKVACSA